LGAVEAADALDRAGACATSREAAGAAKAKRPSHATAVP
jgi:hypothetical protein